MKRFKSPVKKGVHFMLWDCELSQEEYLEFSGLVELVDIHFIFSSNTASFVLTIPRLSPFRLVDETYLGVLGEHLSHKKNPGLPYSNTWKLWGTPFLKELDYATLLFFDRPEAERYQYVILTENECLEFVYPKPKIKKFKKKDLRTLFKMLCDQELKALKIAK